VDSLCTAYHLQLSYVLLPPEILLVFWPDICEKVVGVHENVDKTVNESQLHHMAT
jgi:hypothetical protein